MEEMWKNSAIIAKRNVDDNGTPFSVQLSELKQVIEVHSCIVLNQLPDISQSIFIEGFTEVVDIENLTNRNYKVDYANGVVYFHPVNIGKTLAIEYRGIGYCLLSASRIYTKYDKQGNILETLEELIDRGKLYIKAIETLGGAVEVINKLDQDIVEGDKLHNELVEDILVGNEVKDELVAKTEIANTTINTLVEKTNTGNQTVTQLIDKSNIANQKKQALDDSITRATNANEVLTNTNQSATQTNLTLQQTIATGQDSINTINATGNKSLVIGASQFVNNEYTWTHSMNNDNLIVNFVDSDTKEPLMPDYKIIDKNNILIRNSVEHPNIKVVLSASFYQGNALFGTNVEEFAGDSITPNTKKVRLKDGNGVLENPITDSDAVFMPDGTTKLTKTISDINSSLEHKANENEVIKKGQVDLDEMTERTLQAIQGGEGASFELLSIPRDSSVDINKLDDDFQTILFPQKSIKYPIDDLDETATTHINANVRFIQKEIIYKNSYLNYINVFLGNDSSLVGGTLKLELFSIDGENITKYYEKSFVTKIGVNKLDVNILIKKNTYIAFSRSGYSLLKYKQGTENNCYYTSDINTNSFDLSSLNFGNFILSMKVEILDLGIRTFKLETSNVLLVDKENGDFTTIQDAINYITDDSESNPYTIIVGQGVFPRFSMRSSVTGISRTRYISIIGTNKYTSIIRDTSGHYVTGSCDIWNKGTIENLTIEVTHENDISEENRKSYALHFDFGQCDTEVRNCILISHQAPAVGIGLYQDTTIKFKDCELYNLCPADYGTLVDYGAIFCHSQSAENITNQNIILENCKVISQNGDKGAWFSKIGTGGEMVVESINTMYFTHKEGGTKVVNNATLSPYSYGNNASNMNS